jgi:hypothetical protein
VSAPPNNGAPPRAPLAASGLIGIAAALFWWRFHAEPPSRGSIYPADLLHYYYPRGEAVAQRLLSGELPLWNPRLCGGIPELATAQTAVLSPQTWLFAALPMEQAIPLRVFLECWLGGAFASLWLSRLGLGALPSALGGALFLSTCLLGQSFWPPVVSTLLWLPALLWCVESLAQRWGWRAWLGLVACTALQALAGFPQFAFYSFHLVAPYALLRVWVLRGASGASLRTLLGLVGAVALGLGVAGAQLLPSVELARASSRAERLSPQEMHYLGASARAGVALRNAVDPAPKGLAFDYPGGGNYLGIATLLLLVLGAALGPPRLVWPLLALGALALLLSDGVLGPGAPLYRAYLQLPGTALFRMPERLRIVTLVAAIAVACIGLDRVARGTDGLSRRRVLATPLALALATAGIAASGAPGAALRAAVALGLIAAAAALRRPAARTLVQALLCVAVLADLLAATAAVGSFRSFPAAWSRSFHVFGYTLLDGDGLARLLEQAGWQRVEIERARPDTGAGPIAAADRLDCLEPLAPRDWLELLHELPPSQRETLYDVASVATLLRPRRVDLRPEALTGPYAAFHARYRAGGDPVPGRPPGFAVDLVANPDALPRAYWIEGHAVRTLEQTLAHLRRGDFDFQHAVLLESDPGGAIPARPGAPQAAEIVAHVPERVEIAVDAPRDGLLVLTDAWYPGWRATRDGQDAPILRANGLFRAVVVPAGRSRVIFEYRPESFRRGLTLSALSLALAVAIPLAARRVQRRPAARAVSEPDGTSAGVER